MSANAALYSLHADMTFVAQRQKKRQYHTSSIMSNMLLFFFMMMFASQVEQTEAQTPVQVCDCSPPTYYWKLNFSTGCPNQISTTGGTKGGSGTCVYDDFGSDFNNDFTPVVVTDVQVIELDVNLLPIKGLESFNVSLVDGEVITFQSQSTLGEITGGLQGEIRAVNAAGQAFSQKFIIRLSNICEILPFNEGDSLGFLQFVSGIPSTFCS